MKLYQYPFSKKSDQELIIAEIKTLLAKSVIVEKKHERRGLISPIFVREKSDGGFRLIPNLKRLNENIEYKKFKMETISTILHLVRPGMYMAKLDIKDAYYSGVPICEDHQSLLKFQYQTSLLKFTALPNGYTEGPRKFTKLMKPLLAFLRKTEKTLVAGYFDDLITMNSTHSSCCDNISKIILLYHN